MESRNLNLAAILNSNNVSEFKKYLARLAFHGIRCYVDYKSQVFYIEDDLTLKRLSDE